MADNVEIDPAGLSMVAMYDLLSRLVVPRPIALVSSLSAAGVPNLAPFSFFMVGGANPASLVFCPVRASGGRKKDTLANIEETGEYVIHLVDRAMTDAMNATSASLPPEASEWGPSGFTPVSSTVVAPKRVAESPVAFEMKLFQIVHHGDGDGAATYVIGEVVQAHVRVDVWNSGDVRPLQPISRLGGSGYLDLQAVELFELDRPSS
ncbi:MAG: flavin reductase family protein [Armatimonadetes bacterium]|nr:flavin reductase family protein [Armatimonadota bacterium]